MWKPEFLGQYSTSYLYEISTTLLWHARVQYTVVHPTIKPYVPTMTRSNAGLRFAAEYKLNLKNVEHRVAYRVAT